MAISINWATRVISVPRSDLELIQSDPSYVYNLSLNWFRVQLKDQEDNADGMLYPITHTHNTEATLSGLTYARMIQIINNYTVTFEDGQYAVNLTGANSNVADVTNVNQVSVRPQNSAGMTSSPAIEHGSFGGCVSLDTGSAYYGTVYPVGTPLQPVNNLDDALAVATQRGFTVVKILSDLTITAGQDVSGYTVTSDDWRVLTLESGAISLNTVFAQLSLYGELSGEWNILMDCWVYTVTNFIGWMRGGSFEVISLAPYIDPNPLSFGSTYFDDIVPMYANTPAILNMAEGVKITFTGCSEIVQMNDLGVTNVAVFGLRAGELIVDSSCLGGLVIATGTGTYTNNSLLAVEDEGLSNADTVRAELTPELEMVELSNKVVKNKRVITADKKLVVYDDDGVTPILSKDLKDITGGAISDLAAGVLAQEEASSV